MTPIVAHAIAYPFFIPGNSYVLDGQGYREIESGHPLPDLSGLTAVLASGSNQSPEQLSRKFKHLDEHPIPVLKVQIKDFDAVYSAHFSAYGSIPATLHYQPGVEATLFTTWLNDAQLQRMHETEVAAENYDYVHLEGAKLTVEGGERLDGVHAYISRRGALCHHGSPLSLAAVSAAGRCWPQFSQFEVQSLARDRLSPGTDLDTFIAATLNSPDIRHARCEQLAGDALPFIPYGPNG